MPIKVTARKSKIGSTEVTIAMKTRRSRGRSCCANLDMYTCGESDMNTAGKIICGTDHSYGGFEEGIKMNEDRSCRKCKFIQRSIHETQFDQCVHSGMWGSAYCESEREHGYDRTYNKCGIEGRLWEPKPLTLLERLIAHISHHIHGPKEQAEQAKQKNLWAILKEAVKGPEGGNQKVEESPKKC